MKKFNSYDDFVEYSFDDSNMLCKFGSFLGLLLCFFLCPLYIVFVALRFVVVSFICDFYGHDCIEKEKKKKEDDG